LAASSARGGEPDPEPFPVIDTNVSLFRWPFRRLPLEETDTLALKLRSLGITQAWAGSFEGLLQRDLSETNRRLAEECQRHQLFVPIGSINLSLPGWEHDLKTCIERHKMPGVRLYPACHGYALDEARFAKLLKLASPSGCLVQIAAALEDARTQHEKLLLPDVGLAPLPEVLSRFPRAKVQILNYRPQPAMMEKLSAVPNLCFDVARVEGTDGVPRLVEQVSKERVLFGSHAPFLIPEAALIRVHESSQLDEASLRAVYSENAKKLLADAPR
jgi:predicted TIM-barrel fold metal-dependent hydrolase